jgi:hypothetical protein
MKTSTEEDLAIEEAIRHEEERAIAEQEQAFSRKEAHQVWQHEVNRLKCGHKIYFITVCRHKGEIFALSSPNMLRMYSFINFTKLELH